MVLRLIAAEIVREKTFDFVRCAAGGVQMWSLDGATDRLFRHGSDWPRYQLSDNGQLLVTLSKTFLRVWDVATGAVLFQLAFPDLYYKNVLFLGADDDLVAETIVPVDKVF